MDGKTLYVILTANAAAYDAAMDRSGGKTRGLGKDVQRTGREIDGMNKRLSESAVESRKVSSEIDRMSGRLRVMLDLFTLFGPATIPITAVAIPALTGLAAWAGIAATGLVATVLAFQGIGDTFKAIQKAELEPTAENLAEVHRLMTDLQPAARGFIAELDHMGPALDSLQDLAADGFFPGATDGLRDLRSMMPTARRLIEESADAVGDLAAQQADAFDSKRGREFMAFLTAEVRPTLSDMAYTSAELASGLAEMWMAFDPLNDDFGDWMLDKARGFDAWANNLDRTEGFEDFLDYIHETGPQVGDTLGSLANMLVQLTQAAAPLGDEALHGIEMFANAVSAIADSPLGTPLLTALTAATALNRGLAITSSLLKRIGVESAAGGMGREGVFGSVSASAASGSAAVKTFAADLRSMSQEYRRAAVTSTRVMPSLFSGGMFGAGTSYSTGAGGRRVGAMRSGITAMLSQTSEASQRTARTLGAVTKAAGGAGAAVGAMAVLTTDLGQGLGLSNTAMLGMVGSMKGPWGAAVGAGVGLSLDFAAAARKGSEAVEEWNNNLDLSNFASFEAALASADEQIAALRDDTHSSSGGEFLANMFDPDVIVEWTQAAWGARTEEEKLAAGRKDLAEMTREAEEAAIALAFALGGDVRESIFGGVDDEKAIRLLERAAPAMDTLGISWDDLAGMDSSQLGETVDRIAAFTRNADSAEGRTRAFASSVADLGNDAMSTADSAAQMSAALEALLGPELNAEEATDAWHKSLKALRAELQEGAGFTGYKQAALENREITRDYANDSIARLEALALVGTTTQEDMALAVAATRREFIQSGIAAGIDEKVIRRRARALGLTPELVRTIFENVNISKTELEARRLREVFRTLPRKVRADIRADGIPRTKKQIDELVEKYNLSEKDRKALVSLRDGATPALRRLLKLLGVVDDTLAAPEVPDTTGPARRGLGAVLSFLDRIDGFHATSTVTTLRKTVGAGVGPAYNAEEANGGIWSGGVKRFADGGYGTNGVYYPRQSQIVRGGANILWGEEETGFEAYISGKPSQRARNVDILGETARRFGMQLTGPGVAANGRYGSEAATGGGGRAVVIKQVLPDRMTLVVDGTPMTAYVRRHAADVVHEREQVQGRAAGTYGRMSGWGDTDGAA